MHIKNSEKIKTMKIWSLPIKIPLEIVFDYIFFFKLSSTLTRQTVLTIKICNLLSCTGTCLRVTGTSGLKTHVACVASSVHCL